MVRRITARDPAERMPPPEAKKPLDADEIAVLREWIADGATYDRHWAFVPPRRRDVPSTRESPWVRNDIDAFVLERMSAAGLAPSREADRYTLVRRLYLDLIGIPPTPEEADRFVADERPDAYERQVDELLASPRYGERWARRWLDLARYADTNGYEKDRPRTIWPYRDWVIRAINDDMPFDRFTVEQLAGDMLPDAGPSQRIATGFHRNTMLNEEGGVDPLEFRYYAVADRVETTGATWLGLTLGCAQCHSHKFDPISHREYFGLFAFLNNADEPEMELVEDDSATRFAERLAEARRRVAALPAEWPSDSSIDDAFASWKNTQRAAVGRWVTPEPQSLSSNLPYLERLGDGSILATGDTTKHDVYSISYALPLDGVTAIRLEALPDDRLPARGPGTTYYEGRKGDFFLGELRVHVDGEPVRFAGAVETYAKNQFGANPVSAALTIDGDLQTGWSVAGRQGERHVAVYRLATPAPAAEWVVEMHFGRHFASSLGRFRLSFSTDDSAPSASELQSDVVDALGADEATWTDVTRDLVWEAFLLSTPELAKQAGEIRALRSRPRRTTTLVMSERPPANPRTTYRHHRGEYLQPREPIGAATPEVLPPFPDGAPRDRLGFARWLVSPDNPLVARVTVNRQWQAFFGRGLVATLDDFGLQGEAPTHPALLDWLAVELIEGGWSRKRLHRLIVMSATYRQDSRVADPAVDPTNRLLARGPRVRLDAEVLRDSMLAAAGLLSEKMYGPPVRPPQPSGVTEVAWGKPKWQASEGEDRRRRSIYTYVKRTAPFAMVATFDGPSGERCVARRDRSNTPLQALTLLNDVQVVEASRALGGVIASTPGSDEERVVAAFRRVLTRPPSETEQSRMLKFVGSQRRRLENGDLDPLAIVGDGAEDPEKTAIWTSLARALFNLDEAVTRG